MPACCLPTTWRGPTLRDVCSCVHTRANVRTCARVSACVQHAGRMNQLCTSAHAHARMRVACRPQELCHHVRQAPGRLPGGRADQRQGPELHVCHRQEVSAGAHDLHTMASCPSLDSLKDVLGEVCRSTICHDACQPNALRRPGRHG